jgi:hypothetical protein
VLGEGGSGGAGGQHEAGRHRVTDEATEVHRPPG